MAIFISESIISDGAIRVLFRVYFIIVMIFIGVVGSWCCHLHVRHRLLSGRTVPLTATAGWVQGPVFAKIFLQLRRIPGGWLGWLMLLATLLDLTGEFGVAKTVTMIWRPSTSTWYQGMIVDKNQEFHLYPDINFGAYTYAATAQQYSYSNANLTGLGENRFGIYQFVAYDFKFMAN